ncbi:MAG TPA: lamin tail domain-containing protein [Candidatus Saccharimonadales bacterium]|nr:lamin tail domain-containing protein [Candidatus Saccharimonadales bacterium]
MGIVLGVFGVLCLPVAALPVLPPAQPDLVISELNITGDEFVVLQNRGEGDASLADYWLGYISNDGATATPSQQLPAATLHGGEAIVLNNGAAASCGAVMVDDLAFSLANSAGTLALWHFAATGNQASFGLSDSVSWGKSPTAPAYLHIADETNVEKQSLPNATWYKPLPKAAVPQNWQVGSLDNCSFTPVVAATSTNDTQVIVWHSAADSPPFVVMPAIITGRSKAAPRIPAGDIGLKGLQISEFLPNPASPKTDAEGEFIELYNPNGKVFDLSGFKLQYVSSTSATTHTFTFPDGTKIAARQFKAFFAPQTHISLSNSGGQLWFVDPLGNTVAKSDPYGKAKDGLSWIFAGGKWQWTALPTPNATNRLAALAGTATPATATVNGKKITAVKGAATTSGGSTTASGTLAASQAPVTPVHPLILVAVVAAALLYGAYEYRTDLANRLYQLRAYRRARRSHRS